MSSSAAAAAADMAAAKRAEAIWRWEYRLYCERVVKQAVERPSKRLPRLPTEVLGIIVELACDRSTRLEIVHRAITSRSPTVPDETNARFDTLSLMAVSWALHDLARPFLYEVVAISTIRAFESFFCIGARRLRRPAQEKWRMADYARVRYFSLGHKYKTRPVELPIAVDDPFPRLDVLVINFLPRSSGAILKPSLVHAAFDAFRHSTPVYVAICNPYTTTIDLYRPTLDAFADSPRILSIVDLTWNLNDLLQEFWDAAVESDTRSLLYRRPEEKEVFEPPREHWPSRAPPGYVSSSEQ